MNLLCQKGCCTRNQDAADKHGSKHAYKNLEDNEISFINNDPGHNDSFHQYQNKKIQRIVEREMQLKQREKMDQGCILF
jgi:predicted transcriptional regulator